MEFNLLNRFMLTIWFLIGASNTSYKCIPVQALSFVLSSIPSWSPTIIYQRKVQCILHSHHEANIQTFPSNKYSMIIIIILGHLDYLLNQLVATHHHHMY